MPFQVNGGAPPVSGKPYGQESRIIQPEATGRDGMGRDVGAIGYPSYLAHFPTMTVEALGWYMDILAGDLSVELTSLQVWDIYANEWTTFTGHATMHRPTIGGQKWHQSAYTDVRILFTDLY